MYSLNQILIVDDIFLNVFSMTSTYWKKKTNYCKILNASTLLYQVLFVSNSPCDFQVTSDETRLLDPSASGEGTAPVIPGNRLLWDRRIWQQTAFRSTIYVEEYEVGSSEVSLNLRSLERGWLNESRASVLILPWVWCQYFPTYL